MTNTQNAAARLAAALRDLEATKQADEWIKSLPVVDIDTWAVEHAPEWIAEIEARDGVPHWTTRQRAAGELLDLPDPGNRPPSLIDRYGGSTAIHAHAMRRLTAAGLRHTTAQTN